MRIAPWISRCIFLAAVGVGHPWAALGAGPKPGVVPVELSSARGGEIRRAEARWEGSELVVRGRVTRLHPSLVRWPVHLEVCGPDGRPVAGTEVSPLPRGSLGKGRRPASFTTRFEIPGEHREGLRVRVAYGEGIACPGGPEQANPG